MSHKIAILIEGNNHLNAARGAGFETDFGKVRTYYEAKGFLTQAHYFTTYFDEPSGKGGVRGLLDWLEYNGYHVTARLGREYAQGDELKRVRGSVNVDLAVKMIELAARVEEIVLFSGDGELIPAVEAAQRLGAKVTVVSSAAQGAKVVSDELRRQCDEFVEIASLARAFARDAERAPRRHEAGPAPHGQKLEQRYGIRN